MGKGNKWIGFGEDYNIKYYLRCDQFPNWATLFWLVGILDGTKTKIGIFLPLNSFPFFLKIFFSFFRSNGAYWQVNYFWEAP
jgi:hypothetical protein